jgi:hypothetical protein
MTTSSPPGANTAPSSAHSNSQFTFTPNSYQRTNGLNSPHSSHLQTQHPQPAPFISLLPYIRRLIITGFDKPPILHGFFGDSYKAGISPHLDCERRNFLFTAKHGGWRTCKKFYDTGSAGGGDESAPFMKPLEDASAEELEAAEQAWSKWLAMEDWMVGERSLGEAAMLSLESGCWQLCTSMLRRYFFSLLARFCCLCDYGERRTSKLSNRLAYDCKESHTKDGPRAVERLPRSRLAFAPIARYIVLAFQCHGTCSCCHGDSTPTWRARWAATHTERSATTTSS